MAENYLVEGIAAGAILMTYIVIKITPPVWGMFIILSFCLVISIIKLFA